MFGTLSPQSCGLDDEARLTHRRFYCGTCKSLGDHFGQPHRATLSHDAVFLAVLADALQTQGADDDQCRCPMMPVVHRPTVSAQSPAMRYAAAMQMLLADQWLADKAVDGRTFARILRPLSQGPARNAQRILQDLGIELSALDGFEHTQAHTEELGITTADEAAEPTAAALELIFATMTRLPGTHPDAARAKDALAALGRAVGRTIYLADALDDLRQDCMDGDFNPCLRWDGDQQLRIDPQRVRDAIDSLRAEVRQITDILRTLPLLRHRQILDSILGLRLRNMANEATSAAQACLEEEERRRLETWRQRHWASRMASQVAAIFLFAWTWMLAQGTALAQRAPGAVKGGKTRAGAKDQQPPAEPTDQPSDVDIDSAHDAASQILEESVKHAAKEAASFRDARPNGPPDTPDVPQTPDIPDAGSLGDCGSICPTSCCCEKSSLDNCIGGCVENYCQPCFECPDKCINGFCDRCTNDCCNQCTEPCKACAGCDCCKGNQCPCEDCAGCTNCCQGGKCPCDDCANCANCCQNCN